MEEDSDLVKKKNPVRMRDLQHIMRRRRLRVSSYLDEGSCDDEEGYQLISEGDEESKDLIEAPK